MPAYQYSTMPAELRDRPPLFEVRQPVGDPPLAWHPNSNVTAPRCFSGNGALLKDPSGSAVTRAVVADRSDARVEGEGC
jgi:hypothetical protein